MSYITYSRCNSVNRSNIFLYDFQIGSCYNTFIFYVINTVNTSYHKYREIKSMFECVKTFRRPKEIFQMTDLDLCLETVGRSVLYCSRNEHKYEPCRPLYFL